MSKTIAILGAGNIGASIARGLIASNEYTPQDITLTRRKIETLDDMKSSGFVVTANNAKAVANNDILIIAVEPLQVDELLDAIKEELDPTRHTLISIVTGVTISQLLEGIGKPIPLVRAMPNTAIAVRASMTCLATGNPLETRPAAASENAIRAIETARDIFGTVGETLVISEEQMIAATALGACGVAFFLRAIRAASQGGIEIGFHSQEAFAIVAQTAKGAATLLQEMDNHPEFEIDKVTTPRGCTIAGLNKMEHEGFSSAMITGITVSASKAAKLYSRK